MKKCYIDKICNIIGIICLILGAGVLFRTACLVASTDIWFDELFTVELASKKTPELIALASLDVHPPLYYLIVRWVYLVLLSIVQGIRIEVVAKITSIIPFFLIMTYDVTYVRKHFGWLSAGLLMLFVELMPELPGFMVEARMYSWAMFAVLAMYIHGMEFIDSQTNKRGYIHLVIACLYGIGAMYLHYFAFIGAAAVAFILMVYACICKKEARISILVCMLVCIVAYIPWIKVVISQVGAVAASYWIPPVSVRTLAGCVKYIFKPAFEREFFNYACVVVLLVGYVWLFVSYIKRHGRDWKSLYVIGTVSTLSLLVVVGLLASLIIRPIFVYRYMTPAMSVFWMGYAILIGDLVDSEVVGDRRYLGLLNKIGILIVSFVMLTVAVRDFNLFRWEEQKKTEQMKHTQAAFERISTDYSGEILVCNFNQVQAVLWHYLNNESILWGETEETLIAEICNRYPINMTDDIDKLVSMVDKDLDGEYSFIFIGSGNAREEIIDIWEDNGMNVQLLEDSCLLERYYFNIYRVASE